VNAGEPTIALPELSAIAIGGSAGGIEALRTLLPALPPTLDVPVFVALHLKADAREDRWPRVFADCAVKVKEAEDKEIAEPGTVYFAPADYHLLVDSDGTMSLSTDPRVHASRPSIDVLLESAAWAYGQKLLGIVLSGANADGASGLREVCDAGGTCWVQTPEEAVAPIMPRSALRAVPEARALGTVAMAGALRELGR
jgi:two-component system chemotaxis response regulator CheB